MNQVDYLLLFDKKIVVVDVCDKIEKKIEVKYLVVCNTLSLQSDWARPGRNLKVSCV